MTAIDTVGADALALNQWYPIAAVPEIPMAQAARTQLLGVELFYKIDQHGDPAAHRSADAPLPTRIDFGYLWTSLGDPPDDLFEVPEADDVDRRDFNSCSFGIQTSGPRAVENFLDMGHLPFVHAGLLGEEPYTEIVEYGLEVSAREVLATKCLIYQPKASAASTDGAMVDYTFRVTHPMCALLYKSTPVDETRLDVVGLFIQPMRSDHVRAHLWDCRLDETNTDTQIRRFAQSILAQDKPILENQVPKELPLLADAEMPVRSDKTSTAYRGWLLDMGWTYGVTREPASNV